VRITVEGRDLPGARSAAARTTYAEGRVGVQRGEETVELQPLDLPSVSWSFDASLVRGDDGALDLRGPHVQGRRGDRFLYLVWGRLAGDAFTMQRRAKLMLAPALDQLAAEGADDEVSLVGRLGLTAADGSPVCAAVRPPAIEWSVVTPGR
jgi:hypothetical protein